MYCFLPVLVLGLSLVVNVWGETPMAGASTATEILSVASQNAVDQNLLELQNSYDQMRGMQADFEQTYVSKLGKEEKNSGVLILQKPGKMKWTYKTPKGKYMVTNGERFVLYDPKTNQAVVQLQNPDTKLPVAMNLLFGGVKFKDIFEITKSARDGQKLMLSLKPKEKMPNVQMIYLEVETGSRAKIIGTTIVDDLGGSNILRFSKVNLAPTIAKNAFDAGPPKGATVVSGNPLP